MEQPPKLLDRISIVTRSRHLSPRTEEAYRMWAKRFILFHAKRHPSAMGADEVNAFLSHLAVEQRVSAATQNQALSALLFLYREVLGEPLPWLADVVRAQRPLRVPEVLTVDEVRAVLAKVSGLSHLVVLLLYGSGLRRPHAVRVCEGVRGRTAVAETSRTLSEVQHLVEHTSHGVGDAIRNPRFRRPRYLPRHGRAHAKRSARARLF